MASSAAALSIRQREVPGFLPEIWMAYYQDEWPKMQDGTDFDGMNLLTLVRNGNSPFVGAWNVNLLIQEIEENLATQVPVVSNGSNHFFFFAHRVSISNCRIFLMLWPVFLAAMSICPTTTRSQLMIWFLRSSLRQQSTNSCDRMPVSCLLAFSTTVSLCSMYLSDLMFLMILPVVGYSCLKSQRERIIYGMNSAPKRRVRSYPFVNRLFVLNKFGSIQLLTCSLGVSSYSDGPYSCITFQLQSPA